MGAKERFKKEFDRGTDAEMRFKSECLNRGISFLKSSESEDMECHYDCIISRNGESSHVEIKGLKKISRSDQQVQEKFLYLELKNVNGNPGWVYGAADYFVFETFERWYFITKNKLLEIIETKVDKNTKVDKASDSLYKIYSRKGRQDEITMINTKDIIEKRSAYWIKTV